MSLMMIYQGMNDFARNISRQSQGPSNLPPGWGGGGGGQQDSAANMLPMLLDMKKFQAAQANQLADNQLQRDQFNATQAAAQSQQDAKIAAARALSAREGIPFEIALASMDEHPGPLIQALGENRKNYTMDGVRYDANNNAVAETPQIADQGLWYRTQNKYAPNVSAQRYALEKARSGATRLSVDARNQNNGYEAMLNVATEQRKTMGQEYKDAYDNANVANRAWEVASKYPDIVGPGSGADQSLREIQAFGAKHGIGSLPQAGAEKLAAYNLIKEGQFDVATKKVQKLRPASDTDFNGAKEVALGPQSTVPEIAVKALRARADADYQLSYLQEYDRTMGDALRSGSYNPASHEAQMREWLKSNSPYGPSFVDELKGLAAAYPAGGSSAPPPPNASVDDLVNYYKAKK